MGVFISAYRKLTDYQFKNHHDSWLNEGRPTGGKITRSKTTFISSDIAQFFCILSRLFSRPDWLTEGSDADLYRSKMIRWAIVSLLSFLATGSGLILFIYVISKAG